MATMYAPTPARTRVELGSGIFEADVAPTGDLMRVMLAPDGSAPQTLIDTDLGGNVYVSRDGYARTGLPVTDSAPAALGSILSILGPSIPGLLSTAQLAAKRELAKTQDATYEIIPERSPTTVFARISTGCLKACSYCTLGTKKLVLLTPEEYLLNVGELARGYERILDGNHTSIDTFFFNGADILYLDMTAGRQASRRNRDNAARLQQSPFPQFSAATADGLGLRQAITIAHEYFPHIANFAGYIGSDTVLKIEQQTPGYFQNLRRFVDEQGLSLRLWNGIETAHDAGSRRLAKNITAADKLTALKHVMDAGFDYNIIFQRGVLGKEFTMTTGGVPATHEWSEVVASDVKFVDDACTAGHLPKIHISRFAPDVSLPINTLITDRLIIPHNEAGLEQEVKAFMAGLAARRAEGLEIFDNYQYVLHQAMRKSDDPTQLAHWL